MKRNLCAIISAIIFLFGCTGCLQESAAEKERTQTENQAKQEETLNDNTAVNQAVQAKQEEMLNYIQDTYNQTFSVVEFVPAIRGFNDFMNESILVVGSDEYGFLEPV